MGVLMKPAPIPDNEAARMADVQAANILNTPREERFDRLTDLAKEIFGVNMALITIVDSDRQWFKSACGLDGVSETPRDAGFCAHAIFEPEGMIIPDATKDPRFADNPFVTGAFGLRFYAGVPLRGPSGQGIGAFCLVDQQPHEFGARQLSILKKIAALVQSEVERP